MKILYIEDNAVNLSLIERIAQMNRHELLSHDEAEVALETLAQDASIDLILLDIQLAGDMDGIGLAKALRARGDQRPIIAITAYAMVGDKERILAAGCNEYLPKPLPIAEFLQLLAKYDPAQRPRPAAASTPEMAPVPVVLPATRRKPAGRSACR
ncbi:MAG: response regulator [Anaerolineae bacterium]|nr:response regulator [Anaerolineae bacterium]